MEDKKMELFKLIYDCDVKCSLNHHNEGLYKLLIAEFDGYMKVLDTFGLRKEYTDWMLITRYSG